MNQIDTKRVDDIQGYDVITNYYLPSMEAITEFRREGTTTIAVVIGGK